MGTFRTETFAECGEKSELEDCGLMHFNRHDNRGYKWCTPAKVDKILENSRGQSQISVRVGGEKLSMSNEAGNMT